MAPVWEADIHLTHEEATRLAYRQNGGTVAGRRAGAGRNAAVLGYARFLYAVLAG